MCKGLSKQQIRIVGNLVAGRVRQGADFGLMTSELVRDLWHCGLLDDTAPQRQLSSTVRRACTSLRNRGLVTSTRQYDDDQRAYAHDWSATEAAVEQYGPNTEAPSQ